MNEQNEQQFQAEPQAENTAPVNNQAEPEAPKKAPAKKLPVKLICIIAAVVVAVVLLIVIIASAGGSATGAIKDSANINVQKSVSYNDYIEARTNGYLASEFKGIVKLISKTNVGEKVYDDFEDGWESNYKETVKEFGENIKLSIDIGKKYESKNRVIDNREDDLRGWGDTFKKYVKDYKKMDDDDKEGLAKELGVKVSDVDKCMEYVSAIAEELKTCSVTAGQDIEVTLKVKGDDDSTETDTEVTVIKVNGHWIIYNDFSEICSKIRTLLNKMV